MATFAIVRQDGEADKAEGASVADIANRYGWPGNGSIVPWDGTHDKALRHTFTDPDNQRKLLADKPTKAEAKAEAESEVKVEKLTTFPYGEARFDPYTGRQLAGQAPKLPDAPTINQEDN